MKNEIKQTNLKFKIGTIVQVRGVLKEINPHSRGYMDGLGVVVNQNTKGEYLIFFGSTALWIKQDNAIEKFREQDVDKVNLESIDYHIDPNTGKYVDDFYWLWLCTTIEDFKKMSGLDAEKTTIRALDEKARSLIDQARDKILNGERLSFDEEKAAFHNF